MAQVSLQVIVKRDDVDKLQADINSLKNTKITIDTSGLTKNVREAQQATQGLEKAEQAALKTEQERAKVIKEQERATQETIKTEREKVKITTELSRGHQALAKAEKESYNAERAKSKAEQAGVRLEREKIKLTREQDKATKEATRSTKQHSLAQEILGRTTGEFLARMTAYRAVYAGIRAITNGFKEALQTLKAVDDELVTVRKVTGFDQYQMANVESEAYRVASKYGSNAADYTSGVAAFARAGYKELSGELAELAQKTQIVGDATADVANQFLLSVDAAYKYHGSISALTAVLDGANELDNKYATSIEKIAEGMGIVAPVAAQMHVGVDKLAASIGTITAVTQRSGTETARALRALFLNIVGDTKTEIEEGVTWTTGEIEGLKDVIKLYAKDAYDAAQATGSIIDPMKAMEGLSKSLKDGVLTEAQLMEMVSDIGGKLRTSQLLALINNWDMYESMLNDYRNAAGSADKEIENAMDSWTRKTNVLKNTWTEFVKTGLSSGFFKTALDGLTAFVERLDSLPAVLTRILMVVAALNMEKITTGVTNIRKKLSGLWTSLKTGVGTIGTFGTALSVFSVAWGAVSFAVESYKRAQEESRKATAEALQEAKNDISTLDELRDRYETIISSTADEATKNQQLTEYKKQLIEQYGFEKEAVEKINAERQTGLELLNQEAEATLRRTLSENQGNFNKAAEIYKGTTSTQMFGGNFTIGDIPTAELERAGAAIRETEDGTATLVVTGKNLRDTYENLGNVMDVLEKKQLSRAGLNYSEELLLDNLRVEYYNLGNEMEKWGSIYEDQVELMAKYNLMMDGVSSKVIDSRDAFDGLKRSLYETYGADKDLWEVMNRLVNEMFPEYASGVSNAAGATDEMTGAVAKETDALDANQKALDKNATSTERAAAAKKDAENAVRKLIPALFDETGELTSAGKAALKASDYLADLANAEMNARLEAAKANYANLRAQLAGVATDALKAAYALIALETAYLNGETSGIDYNAARHLQNKAGNAYSLLSQIQALEKEINTLTVSATAVSHYSSSASSSSGSSGKSYSGGSSGKSYSGGSSGSGGKSSSSSSSASTEDKKLTALKDRVTLLKSELSLMQERGDGDEAQIAKMKEIMKALSKEADYMKSIKGDQATINGLLQEWYSYHNKINDMMEKEAQSAEDQAKALRDAVDAQNALNNAMKQKTVRIYNGRTGQWEWTADPSNVKSAQDSLRDAISNLPENERGPFETTLGRSLMGYTGDFSSIKRDFLPGEIMALLGTAIKQRNGGTYNYGNTYKFGNMTLTEDQAKGMTVYELARLSGTLPIFNRSV